MLSVDRADFCPENSYQDFPQQIGYNATISAPHMVSILRHIAVLRYAFFRYKAQNLLLNSFSYQFHSRVKVLGHRGLFFKLFFCSFQHALALGLLKDHLRDGNSALDIGSGSGYLTVCMALMVSIITSYKKLKIRHI